MIEWLKSISPEWWVVILTAITGICTGSVFIGKWLIKKYGCPIKATVQSLYVFDFEQSKNYVFDLLIENQKAFPITISNIEYKVKKSLSSDKRNNEPLAIHNRSSLHISREFQLPLDTEDHSKHKFVFHVGKKKYTLCLFAQIQNIKD